MAIKQVKFKRLKVNAGFTLSVANGIMAIKVSETHYKVLGETGPINPVVKATKKELVWADTIMVKPWWKL